MVKEWKCSPVLRCIAFFKVDERVPCYNNVLYMHIWVIDHRNLHHYTCFRVRGLLLHRLLNDLDCLVIIAPY